MIANRYKILNKINSGEFGSIYSGEKVRTCDKVAIKMESLDKNNGLLKHETNVYQYLKELPCVPNIKWYGVQKNIQYLVMPLYDYSLCRFIEDKKYMGNRTISQTGEELINIMRFVHEKGIIHRDIKPDNFMIDTANDKIVLIDFGFARRYITADGIHIPYKNGKNIIGTPNYISMNIHNGDEPSRRDDVESVCYILFFLFNNMSIWCSSNEIDMIKNHKLNTRNENDMNPIFYNIFNRCMNTTFMSYPDYDEIIKMIRTL